MRLVLLLLTLPSAVQAQDYTYTINSGSITITKYTGPGGAVTIPETINGVPVTVIGSHAFSGNGPTSVTIPNSVVSVANSAFEGCASLTTVTIPSSVTEIGMPRTFFRCTSLTAITVDALNPVYSSVDGVLFNRSQGTLIQYPGGKGGSYTIPGSVTNIAVGAFAGCASLTSVTIPDGVIVIGWSAFSDCASLTSVTIPNRVVSIGPYAFYRCSSLTNVMIPDGVTSIGDSTFERCTNLTGVTIPSSVTNIEFAAFAYCANLTSVTIPKSVTSIGSGAFANCTSLTSVTIGNGVTNILYLAFGYCSSLTNVYFKGNAPSAGEDVFFQDNVTIYYLPGTTGWGPTFADRPAVLWNPQIQTSDASFGVQANQFGFIVTGTSGLVIVVEACTNLVNPVWSPVATNILTAGSSYFSDPQWTNYPRRFYRLRSP